MEDDVVVKQLADIKNDLQKIMVALGIGSGDGGGDFATATVAEKRDEDMESAVSNVSDLLLSRMMVLQDQPRGTQEEEEESAAAAREDYRDILSEWEDSDFSNELVPEIFPLVCEWIERYGTIFNKPGSQMRQFVKTFKRRIADVDINANANDEEEKMMSIVSDFLIGKPSEIICRKFEIFDSGCESLEALLLRESAVALVDHNNRHKFKK